MVQRVRSAQVLGGDRAQVLRGDRARVLRGNRFGVLARGLGSTVSGTPIGRLLDRWAGQVQRLSRRSIVFGRGLTTLGSLTIPGLYYIVGTR